MQDLSFEYANKIIKFDNLNVEIELFSFENVYGLDPDLCKFSRKGNELILNCAGLKWAGGQEKAMGKVEIRASKNDDNILFNIKASMNKVIRCVKLKLKNLNVGPIVNLRETNCKEIPETGLILKYPNGWRELPTPLVIMENSDGGYLYFRSLDAVVREKRFAFKRNRDDTINVELIFEENAVEMDEDIIVPAWEIGKSESLDSIYKEQTRIIEKNYSLVPFEKRKDVPDWFKKISLIASIHCQHFTGYIFNDYNEVLKKLKWLSKHIKPESILAYLPGWGGRYYWQYGDYRPDPRMGGEKDFKKMVGGARELGIKIMPMFGINYSNSNIDNFNQWGEPARAMSAGGNRGGGSVDWDGSRHYDHGWGVEMNPGAPTWQTHLYNQISNLIEKYKFGGVFLDISAVWRNDPKYNVYKGIAKLIKRIKDNYPDMLVAGEGWYDAFSAVMPLHQSGHTHGDLHWHDVPYAEMFNKYNRSFAHLCLGDPGRGSTGVHELGINSIWRIPLRKGIIPTVTIVEDTLKNGKVGLLEIIQDAQRYEDEFIIQ